MNGCCPVDLGNGLFCFDLRWDYPRNGSVAGCREETRAPTIDKPEECYSRSLP
jgi:hypothetical protein